MAQHLIYWKWQNTSNTSVKFPLCYTSSVFRDGSTNSLMSRKTKTQNSSEQFKSVNDKNSVIFDLMLTSCVLLEHWWDHIVPALTNFQFLGLGWRNASRNASGWVPPYFHFGYQRNSTAVVPLKAGLVWAMFYFSWEHSSIKPQGRKEQIHFKLTWFSRPLPSFFISTAKNQLQFCACK